MSGPASALQSAAQLGLGSGMNARVEHGNGVRDRRKRSRDIHDAQIPRHDHATKRTMSTPRSVQRSRMVAEQLYEWCTQRDDSGYLQMMNDSVRSEAYVLCETGPCSRGALIVQCSDGFSQVTGFSQPETIGRPISMLHGSKTSQDSAHLIESAITQGLATTVQLTSYKRSGQVFWNMVHIVPVPLETATGGKLAFVLLTNVSEHLFCGAVGLFPIGLDFLSEDGSDFRLPRQLLGASLACRAECAALASIFKSNEAAQDLSFCIANPALDLCPISFASDEFVKLNGYDRQSVLGHSCCVAGGLLTDEGRLETLLRAWKKNKLPWATHIVCFGKESGVPVLHDAQLAPLLTPEGVMTRIVVVTHLPATDTNNVKTSSDTLAICRVLKQLADAEATDGSEPQFFLRLKHTRCK